MGGYSHFAGWMAVLATLPCCVLSEESSGRRGFPEPQVLGQTASDAHSLVLDNQELFWADVEGVKQAKPGGAAITRSQQSEFVRIRSLAVVGDTIYWAQESDLWSGTNALVLKASRSGGPQYVIFKGPGLAYKLTANEAGAFFLYAEEASYGGTSHVARVMGVLTDGTVRQYTGALADASGLALDATTIYISSGGPAFPGVEQYPPGRIDACPIAGCESGPVNLADGLMFAPSAVAVYGGFVYGGSYGTFRVPVGGGASQPIGMNECWDIAVDDLGVYCVGQAAWRNVAGVIQHLWETGRDTLLTTTPGTSIAIDRGYVYWTDGGGEVLRAERWSGAVPLGWMNVGAPGEEEGR